MMTPATVPATPPAIKFAIWLLVDRLLPPWLVDDDDDDDDDDEDEDEDEDEELIISKISEEDTE